MKKYAVMGNPIAHSKSPQIHRMFADQAGIVLDYQRILVEPDRFEKQVAAFAESGGLGLNITVPFKQAAFRLAVEHTGRAMRAGAVNTLMLTADGWLGDNTDGAGLVNDIVVNQGFDPGGKRVLVLGAGGAVRGILGALLALNPARVSVANRTFARAESLAAVFKGLGAIDAVTLQGLEGLRFQLVINATSAGLSGQRPAVAHNVFGNGAMAYDMTYGDAAAPFLDWARDCGAGRLVDGLGMLVGQAAESFRLWHGMTVDSRPVIEALRVES